MTPWMWLLLVPNVPEYSRHDESDLDYLTEWYFGFEPTTESRRQSFHDWLYALPLGYLASVPNRDGYKMVRIAAPQNESLQLTIKQIYDTANFVVNHYRLTDPQNEGVKELARVLEVIAAKVQADPNYSGHGYTKG